MPSIDSFWHAANNAFGFQDMLTCVDESMCVAGRDKSFLTSAVVPDPQQAIEQLTVGEEQLK